MGGGVNTPKKERRWLKKSVLFIFYIFFAILIPLVIIDTQFGLIGVRDTTADKKITGWGIIAFIVLAVFIYNEIKKRAKLERDETKKEAIGSVMKAMIIIAVGGLIWLVGKYNWELMIIFLGGGFSELVASIFEIPYNRMVEEDRLIKNAKLEAKIKARLG